MKPHGINSVQLESVTEAFAAAEAFKFAAEHGGEDNPYADAFDKSALVLQGKGEAHELAHGEGSDEPFSLVLEGHMGEMAEMVVRVCASVHPDPLVRDELAGMQRSYEEAVFSNGMSDTPPPEADPGPYRSPFGE
jgi:hypothetical protein